MDTLLQKLVRIVHEHVNPAEAKELKKFRDDLAEYKRLEAGRFIGPRTLPKLAVVEDILDYAIIDGWFCISLYHARHLRDLPGPRAYTSWRS